MSRLLLAFFSVCTIGVEAGALGPDDYSVLQPPLLELRRTSCGIDSAALNCAAWFTKNPRARNLSRECSSELQTFAERSRRDLEAPHLKQQRTIALCSKRLGHELLTRMVLAESGSDLSELANDSSHLETRCDFACRQTLALQVPVLREKTHAQLRELDGRTFAAYIGMHRKRLHSDPDYKQRLKDSGLLPVESPAPFQSTADVYALALRELARVGVRLECFNQVAQVDLVCHGVALALRHRGPSNADPTLAAIVRTKGAVQANAQSRQPGSASSGTAPRDRKPASVP